MAAWLLPLFGGQFSITCKTLPAATCDLFAPDVPGSPEDD
jgi:hypothetical protein